MLALLNDDPLVQQLFATVALTIDTETQPPLALLEPSKSGDSMSAAC